MGSAQAFPAHPGALLAPSAAAQVFVVDDTPGPGVDFAEINEALLVVPDGAVLDVRMGTYDGFTITRPVSIVAEEMPPVRITSAITIDGATMDAQVLLSGLRFSSDLYAQDLSAPLILDDVLARWTSLVRCSDVRIAGLFTAQGVSVTDTQASIVNSSIGSLLTQRAGLEVRGTSKVQLHETEVRGADGANCGPTPGCLATGGSAGPAGPGLLVEGLSRARIVRSDIYAGWGGIAQCGCFGDGPNGPVALFLGTVETYDSTYWRAGVSVNPGTLTVGAGSVNMGQPFPTLLASTGGALGQTIEVVAQSLPGSSGRLIFGRGPVDVSVSDQLFGRLVRADRVASLGATPASGTTMTSFQNPGWPVGTTLWLQTSQTLSDGSTQLSNPVAVIVR